MNIIKRIVVPAALAFTVLGTATACSSTPGDADVLQYGEYNAAHVYVPYPVPHVVHVSYKVYHSDSRMYSTPAYERTYVKDPKHTVIRTTTTRTKTTVIHH